MPPDGGGEDGLGPPEEKPAPLDDAPAPPGDEAPGLLDEEPPADWAWAAGDAKAIVTTDTATKIPFRKVTSRFVTETTAPGESCRRIMPQGSHVKIMWNKAFGLGGDDPRLVTHGRE